MPSVKIKSESRESLISTVKIDYGLKYAYLHVWNRGGKVGTLKVNKEDVREIAHRLLDMTPLEFEEEQDDG